MKQNMGTVDRIVRVIIALTILVLYFLDVLAGNLAYILVALAAVFLLTSLVGTCPIYSILRINTCRAGGKHSTAK